MNRRLIRRKKQAKNKQKNNQAKKGKINQTKNLAYVILFYFILLLPQIPNLKMVDIRTGRQI